MSLDIGTIVLILVQVSEYWSRCQDISDGDQSPDVWYGICILVQESGYCSRYTYISPVSRSP